MHNEQSYEVLDTRLKALEVNMEKLEESISELLKVLQQGQGAVNTLKVLFYVMAPLGALIYWVKDHVKL